MSAIIGIDFGSTVCRTAVFRQGQAELFGNRFSELRLPVLIESPATFTEDSRLGALPVCFRSLKQKAGSEEGVRGPHGTKSVADSLTDLFRQLLEDARVAIGQPVSGAVLTVPGFFPERPRAALRGAALRAGFPAVRLFDEALGVVTGADKPPDWGVALVYALGAGIFSATVMRTTNGKPRVLGSRGNRLLGGYDFDAALIGTVLGRLGRSLEFKGREATFSRLKTVAEYAKIGLSRRDQEECDLNLAELFGGDGTAHVVLTRFEFEQTIAGAVEETLNLARKAVEDAGLTDAGIDRILLVGGSTRIPLIERRLAEEFPVPIVRVSDADIARGAALQGGRLEEADWKRGEPEAAAVQPVTPAPLPAEVESGTWLPLFSPRLLEAETLWNRGERAAAITVFEEMLEQGKRYLGTLYHQVGQGLFGVGQYDEAIPHLEKAVQCNPRDRFALQTYHETLNRKALHLYQTGRWLDARTAIRQALKINAQCPGCIELSERIEQAWRHGRSWGAVHQYGKKGKK